MDIKNEILKHVSAADDYLCFNSFSKKRLTDWILPLVDSMTDSGAIPYLLNKDKKERYRASPLASTIIGLDSANLLPEPAIISMQNKLLQLRDFAEDEEPEPKAVNKKEEDLEGWSYSEGVSVWSTSMALLALMDHRGLGCKKATQFKQSILWLARQKQDGQNGWGYQLSENCVENIPMTSLAVRAIATCYQAKDSFSFTRDEESAIFSAMTSGYQFIKDNLKSKKNKIWWEFKNNKSCIATVWALCALKELSRIGSVGDSGDFYQKNRSKGIRFVVSCIPNKNVLWKSEQFVCEGGAKYSKQKNYYSFSSTLLLDLFEIGLSPYHPKVVKQIHWLLENPDKWQIEGYDRTDICTFTYAMVLGVIVKWDCLVGTFSAEKLLEKSTKHDRLWSMLFGLPVYHHSAYQMTIKHRIILIWIISILIVLAICFVSKIVTLISLVIIALLKVIGKQWNTIVINLISNALYAGAVAALLFFINRVFRSDGND